MRLLGISVLALLAALAAVASPASADEGWVIRKFAADIEIRPDASMRVSESIDVDFGGLQRHGIFRNIPIRYRWDDLHVRVYRLDVRSVTDAGGRALEYEASESGPFAVIKIGDPDTFVTGAQSYRITYDVAGALNSFADHDELFWNVNGGDWDVPTTSVTATVRTGGGLQRGTCFQGFTGSREPCRATTAPSAADFATSRALGSGEQLTIVAALAKGTVREPAPIIERDGENILAYVEPQPAFVAGAVFVFLAGLGALFWRWFTVGRDLRERETIVAEYEPPDALRPAQLGLLVDESADTKDVTATIVDLAVRGYLVISEEADQGLFGKKDWTLTATGKDAADLLPYEKTVYDGLFESGNEVKVSGLRTKFITSLRRASGQLYKDSAKRKWFATRPDLVRQAYVGVAILILLIGAGVAFLLGRTIGAGLVGLALAAVGLIAIPLARVMPAKTKEGAELLRRTLGFRRYMEVAETERQRFAERENIFSAYLPYAIVFGCVERWARAFAGIDAAAAQTASWYVGTTPFNTNALSSSLQGFSSNLGSAIAATASSRGGSGFSGGGGAGGGGGGGGGGSW